MNLTSPLDILLLYQVQRSSSEELAFQPAARFEPVMQEVGTKVHGRQPLPRF